MERQPPADQHSMQFGPLRDSFWDNVHQARGQQSARYDTYTAGQMPYNWTGMSHGGSVGFGPSMIHPHPMGMSTPVHPFRGPPMTPSGFVPYQMPPTGYANPSGFYLAPRGYPHQNGPIPWVPDSTMGQIQGSQMAYSQVSPIGSPIPDGNQPIQRMNATYAPNISTSPGYQPTQTASIRDDEIFTLLAIIFEAIIFARETNDLRVKFNGCDLRIWQ